MLFFAGKEYTYCDVYKASLRIANYLKSIGVEKGDRVGFVLLNSPQALAINFAIFRIGAISVPVSPYWKPEIIRYIISSKQVKTVFLSAKFLEKVLPVVNELDAVERLIVIKKGISSRETWKNSRLL